MRKRLFGEWHQRSENADDDDFRQPDIHGIFDDSDRRPQRGSTNAAGAGYE